MKPVPVLIVLVLAVILSFGVQRLAPPSAEIKTAPSAMARMIETNKLRCGYYIFPPFVMRDQKDGHMSGIVVDMMDYFAQKTGIKVEWTEEVSFGNWVPALQTGRFDAVCAPMWPDAAQNRAVLFSKPMLYSGIYPFVRADETRFGADWHDLDKKDVRMVVQEGNVTAALAREWFSNVTIIEEPASADYGLLLQDVIDKKADVVLWDMNGFIQYSKNNPGKIKKIALTKPLKVMPFEMVVPLNEWGLRDFFNAMIDDIVNTGKWDRIIDKWEEVPGTYLRLRAPYEGAP